MWGDVCGVCNVWRDVWECITCDVMLCGSV